jgi:hypothetical protein
MTESLIERATDLHFRIWNEFVEMPGTKLTLEQVCRLADDEPVRVARALQDLIDAGVLCRIGPYYIRKDLSRFTA